LGLPEALSEQFLLDSREKEQRLNEGGMAMQEKGRLRERVHGAYSAAAEWPKEKHPFPVGRRFAKSLGYPPDLLARLPSVSVEAFSGVSNVSIFADIPVGARVLDLGCGAGLDSLIAAKRVGTKGKVIGLDFSESMLKRAQQALAKSGLRNVEFHQAGAEGLPFEDGSFDVALVNGIFNLNPARDSIFCELSRVLRKDGTVYAAELILREPLPPDYKVTEEDWFA
jgi:arsenite methyltransferase